jgi:hypothetical protein
MFVLSLCLFLFSLYVAVLREQTRMQGQQKLTTIEETMPLANVETGNIQYQEANSGTTVQIQTTE